MSVCLFIVSGRLRCGAFKTFCGCHCQSRKAGTFTCRSRRWVTFHLPKPTTGASRLSVNRQNEFSQQRPTRTRFSSPQSAKARFSLQRSASINFQPAEAETFRSGKARFSPIENGEKFQKAAGAESRRKAASTAGIRFSPVSAKNRLSLVFSGEFRTVLPKIFVRRKSRSAYSQRTCPDRPAKILTTRYSSLYFTMAIAAYSYRGSMIFR